MSPPYRIVVKTKKKICAKDLAQIVADLAQIKLKSLLSIKADNAYTAEKIHV